MFNYDKNYIDRKAADLGFIRNTLEKVYRLADILEYFNTNTTLKSKLALKGGTAINLVVFDLPRLSIDIDLDYLGNDSREEMLANREIINGEISSYMKVNGYALSPKSKNPHSLDSWIYSYSDLLGNRDNIKIEVNYSLRSHIFSPKDMNIIPDHIAGNYTLKCLNQIEIFGSKINALLNRAVARDLYDVNNMIKYSLFVEDDRELLRKSIVFYAAISSKEISNNFDVNIIDSITKYNMRTALFPVVANRDDFDLEAAIKSAKEYISKLMVLAPKEKEFINNFANKKYIPELLFEDQEILDRIKNHPMALWKTLGN